MVFHVKHVPGSHELRRMLARALAVGVALGTLTHSGNVLAADTPAVPQLTTALTVGGGVGNLTDSPSRSAVFHGGGWADVLFVRDSERAVGVGPYVQVATTAFSSLELGAGPSVLVPVGGPVFQFSAGPNLRLAPGGPYFGALGKIFFGSRSYNFHSVYGFAVGGFLESRVHATPGKAQMDLVLGAQIDFLVLSLPVLFAVEAIRGPRDRR